MVEVFSFYPRRLLNAIYLFLRDFSISTIRPLKIELHGYRISKINDETIFFFRLSSLSNFDRPPIVANRMGLSSDFNFFNS